MTSTVSVIAGIAVFFVLAQLIDGRVAWFVGFACTLALASWLRGRRRVDEYVGIAVCTALGFGAFFLLVGVNGWLALIVGTAVAALLSTAWTASRQQLQAEQDIFKSKA